MTTTYERLSAILVKDYKLDPERVDLDAPLESLGIDSLGALELLWSIEDVFKIKMTLEPADLPTLGAVVRYVDELVARQAMVATSASVVSPHQHAS